LYTAWKHILG